MKKRRQAFMDNGFQRCWLASQRGIEPPTPRLGATPGQYFLAPEKCRKILILLRFSLFSLLTNSHLKFSNFALIFPFPLAEN